jgi:hypothetical protein
MSAVIVHTVPMHTMTEPAHQSADRGVVKQMGHASGTDGSTPWLVLASVVSASSATGGGGASIAAAAAMQV